MECAQSPTTPQGSLPFHHVTLLMQSRPHHPPCQAFAAFSPGWEFHAPMAKAAAACLGELFTLSPTPSEQLPEGARQVWECPMYSRLSTPAMLLLAEE